MTLEIKAVRIGKRSRFCVLLMRCLFKPLLSLLARASPEVRAAEIDHSRGRRLKPAAASATLIHE